MRWPWFKKEETSKTEEPELTPGICQCNHIRSVHDGGKGHCRVDVTASVPKELLDKLAPGGYYTCACQIYIRKRDDPSDPPQIVPVDPEVEELRKMVKL